MLELMAVALIYTTIGGAVILALEVTRWRTESWAVTAAISVACGPVVWLFLLAVFVYALARDLKRRR